MELKGLPTDDPYTNEWYRKQFAAIKHLNEVLHNEVVDLIQQVRLLRKQVAEVEKHRSEDMAKIGELNERLNRASDVVKQLTKHGKVAEEVAA